MAEVDRLTTVFDASTQRLEAAVKRIEKINGQTASNVEKRWKGVNDNLGKSFAGGEINRGLDALASRGGAATQGLAGLGVAGLGAAAGVGALFAAMAGARAAAQFSDDIADTANRLHVTTDALQEYRYAIRVAGGDTDGADKALEAFSVTLGKAQQGLAKSEKGFKALGFSEAEIKGFQSAEEALDGVAERISGLSNVQQDAIIQQLGLDGIKPLIAQGADEMRRLRNEAHEAGIVMDASLIKRGAELNDQFETTQQIIDVQMKSALVDLGPVLVSLLGLLADMGRLAADIADSFRSIDAKSTAGLEKNIAGLRELQAQQLKSQGPLRFLTPQVSSAINTGDFKGLSGAELNYARNTRKLQDLENELAQRRLESRPPAVTSASRTLIDTSSSGGGRGGAEVNPFEASNRFADLQVKIDDMLYKAKQDREELAANFGEAFGKFQKDKMSEAFGEAFSDFVARSDAGQNAQVYWEQEAKRLEQAEYDATYNGIRGGLEAVANGDAIAYFTNKLRNAMLDNVADVLTQMLMTADGQGGFLGGVAKIAKFAGFFAGGGKIGAGQWGIAGEAGAEVVSGPATVTPINANALQANAVRGGVTVLQPLHLDLRGAVMTSDLLMQMNAMAKTEAARAGARSLQAARQGAPSLQSRMQLLGIP